MKYLKREFHGRARPRLSQVTPLSLTVSHDSDTGEASSSEADERLPQETTSARATPAALLQHLSNNQQVSTDVDHLTDAVQEESQIKHSSATCFQVSHPGVMVRKISCFRDGPDGQSQGRMDAGKYPVGDFGSIVRL